MKLKPKGLLCFSPAVMLATFATEIALFMYVAFRYKMTSVTRLASGLLFFLALFQLAEYQVCGPTGVNAVSWSKIGYVSITMLPPLGLHLVHAIARRPAGRVVTFGYLAGAIWSALFLFGPQVFSGHECTSNYVIFQLRETLGGLYVAYYYGLLFLAIYLAYRFSQKANSRVKKALFSLVVGYALFLIPTATVNAVSPETTRGIPSIMCGFAVLFAFMLTFRILPQTAGSTKPVRSRTR